MQHSRKMLCRWLGITGVFALLSGCSFDAGIRNRADYLQTAPIEQAPVVATTRSVSVLKDGLACMDRMLRDEGIPTTLIAVKYIPDASGLFSTSTKDMLITALSRMSRTSGTFRVVDYEVDPLRQDTVQTMTGLLLNNGMVDLQKPDIYISGSISFGDKTVVSKRRNIGISTENTDTGFGYDVLGTMVGLELHLGDMNTRTLFPGIDSANEVVVATGGRTIELGGKATGLPEKIYQIGVQFEIAADINQGAGAAVRALVDLAAIELVGKWSRLPYWQCIAYEQNHPEFLRQVREWYDAMSINERITAMQRGLRSTGYWNQETSGEQTESLRRALMHYQADQDLIPSGEVNFETYERLLRKYVVQDKNGRFVRIGWGSPGTEASSMASFSEGDGGQRHIDPALGTPPSPPPPLHLQTIGNPSGIFLVGDPIVFRITPRRGGFLHCYYQDGANTISQVYPNILQPAPQVQGNRAVLIPDLADPNTFMIEATRIGQEELYCAVTDRDISTEIPQNLQRLDLQPLEEVSSLESIKQLFQALPAENGLSEASLQWSIGTLVQ